MDQPRLIPVENETKASARREMQDGKRLLYELTVLQQPQRARACGAGAKCKQAVMMLTARYLLIVSYQ
jgi:hypothetical protein